MARSEDVPQGVEILGRPSAEFYDDLRWALVPDENPSVSFAFRSDLAEGIGHRVMSHAELRVISLLDPVIEHSIQTMGAKRHHILVDTRLSPAGEAQREAKEGEPTWHADKPYVYGDIMSNRFPTRVLYRTQSGVKKAVVEQELWKILGRAPTDDDIEEMIENGALGVFAALKREAMRIKPGVVHAPGINETEEKKSRVFVRHAFSGRLSFKTIGAIRKARASIFI